LHLKEWSFFSGFCGTAPDKDRRDRFRRALTRRLSQEFAVFSNWMKRPPQSPDVCVSAAWWLDLSLLLFLPACGYQVAGRASRLPPDIKTIAVPIFVNDTPKFRVEQKLSAAVTREFIERTRFRVTANPSEADAVLKGTVKDVSSGVVTFDLTTGRATTMQVQVTASIELVDLHTQKVLFSNSNYVFREQYQINPNTSVLFEEEEPALDRLSRDLARTLVTEILENY